MRIHFNNPSSPQEPRIAGADHSVSKPLRDKRGLELTDEGGFVIVEGDSPRLSKEDSERLRLGGTVAVAKKYHISLSSDAAERSKAILVVQSALTTDNPLLEIVELRLDSRRYAEQAGSGQSATRSESKSEGGDKPQPKSEGRSR